MNRPSRRLLEAARNHFPDSPTPTTEQESVYADLLRANVFLQELSAVIEDGLHPLNDQDPLWHDVRAAQAAVARAQEYTRP